MCTHIHLFCFLFLKSDNVGDDRLPERGHFCVSVGGDEIMIGPASDDLILKIHLDKAAGIVNKIETLNTTGTSSSPPLNPNKRNNIMKDGKKKTKVVGVSDVEGQNDISMNDDDDDDGDDEDDATNEKNVLSDGAFSAPTIKQRIREGEVLDFTIYPARHHVLEDKEEVLAGIRRELVS
jgi:hypothetical protein